ncbi:uncharacterized protein LOC125463400 isoform X2 [Stegostoma tigrinum]|uniref:uncharacterized protein LOC125463400 isoform X2 n=1 Tax=Stegostoma tigrinum TaxID=3053191 RepID=UPI002870361F|nr:uncharacterized protein LOC125463400 isoform X2 [Stegostoma tigrinum]
MELECCTCNDLLGVVFQDSPAKELLKFHQCLCQEPVSMCQLQEALSQSPGKDDGENWSSQSQHLIEMERERHRVSNRWRMGGLSAVIHDDGREMVRLATEDEHGVSNTQLLQLVEEKYRILIKHLGQEMLQEHWGEELPVAWCDQESREKGRELEAFMNQCVFHYDDIWTLSQLPGAFRTYSSFSIMGPEADSEKTTLTDGERSRFCSKTASCVTNTKQGVAASLSLLLGLHRRFEQETSFILSTSMSPAQKSLFLLSQHYMQCQAKHQDTFETSALVLSNTEWEESVEIPWYGGTINETLAVRTLQEFISLTLPQKPERSQVTAPDLSGLALLGTVQIQMKILEQLCENHQQEQSLLLQFIYQQKMIFSGVEANTETSQFSDTVFPGQSDNNWDTTGHSQLNALREAFGQYWERNEISEQSDGQSPAIQSLVGLQQRQLAEVRELIRQLEGQSRDDLVHTYCSLFDNLQNHRYHRNLSALLLGQVTPGKDKEPIADHLGACSGPVQYGEGTVVVDSENCDQETVANQNVIPMEQAQIVKIEQEPAPYDSIRMNEFMAETDSGVSDLHNRGTQSLRAQEDRVTISIVRDPFPETQKEGEQGWISPGHRMSQSEEKESGQHISVDVDSMSTLCEKCETEGDRAGHCLGEETHIKPRELSHIPGLQHEVNMILISDEEKENVMKSLTLAQRKAEEKRRRDKRRQTLRVQECLSIVRNRASTVDHPVLQCYSEKHHTRDLHKEYTQWRTKVKETLEQLQQERTFALRSKGERNTASFRELVDPTETEDLTDENWREFSKDVKALELITMGTGVECSGWETPRDPQSQGRPN